MIIHRAEQEADFSEVYHSDQKLALRTDFIAKSRKIRSTLTLTVLRTPLWREALVGLGWPWLAYIRPVEVA